MSVRKILNASSGYTASTATVSAPSDTSFGSTSLLLTGDPSVVDDNFANVSLLLTGNDLLDKSNNKVTVTANGNVAVTSINKKFGTGSYYFDGNRDYLTSTWGTLFSFGTGDFTVEFWCYPQNLSGTSSASQKSIFDLGSSGFQIGIFPSNIHIAQNMVADLTDFNSSIIQNNTWFHVALSRSSNVTRCFINGVQAGSNYSDSTNYTGSTVVIGAHFSVTSLDFQGYIDDLRVTKGVARYTANFTPPTQALPSHEILDSSVYRLPVTTYGNARIDTATKKYGTGSMYFDGTGDYLSIPASSNFNFGSSDFTIECWVNIAAFIGNYDPLMGIWNSSGFSWYVSINAFSNTRKIGFSYKTNSITYDLNFGSANSTGSWFHLAIVRSNNMLYVYKDGNVLNAGGTSIGTIDTINQPLIIGLADTGYFNGYIDDLRITKGIARYTANFTPPTTALPTTPPTIAADPWWGNVSLLLDGNTTDAYDPHWQNVSLMLTGDDLIDWSNQHNTITNNGTATVNTATKKYGTGSISFNGTNQWLRVPASGLAPATNDYTLEVWVYPNSMSGEQELFIFDTAGSLGIGVNGGYPFIGRRSTAIDLTSSTAITTGAWYHLAFTRYNGTTRIFVNGVQTASASLTSNYADGPLDINGYGNGSAGLISCYIDDYRYTKGVARYTANFTPPTAALPSYKIQDRTQNNLTVTPYGNVQLSTDVKKNGTGSMFFDGTGDSITVSSPSNFGTGDYTIEFWVNYASANSNYVFIEGRGSNYNNTGVTLYIASGVFYYQYGANSPIIPSITPPSANTWHHIAACRSNGYSRLFFDGVQQGSAVTDTTNCSVDYGIIVGNIGGGIGGYSLLGYMDDVRITKGVARYASNFTPPSQSFPTQYISTGFDPNYADVSLLLTGEGTNGSTTFTDLSSGANAITAYGTAQVNTSQKKYGVGSIYFPNATSYLKCSNSAVGIFNTDDFTIECWSYFISVSTTPYYQCIFCTRDGTTNASNAVFYGVTNTGYLVFYTTSAILTASSTITANTWNHVALVRKSGVVSIYLNGQSQGSAAFTTSLTGTIPTIGNEYNLGTGAMNGYFDDFRITKGVARYTSNFTPPTYALATTAGTAFDVNRADTSLLLRGNGTNGSTSFTDESPNTLTVTNNGSVTVNTSVKKYGTGSMYFDGTNYLSLASNAALNLSGVSWTVELWCYPTTASLANRILFTKRVPNSGTCSYQGYLNVNNSGISFFNGTEYQSSTTLDLNAWNHIAYVCDRTNVKVYKNGVLILTASATEAANNTETLLIGNGLYTGYSLQFPGYIDDFRITKGYARYTANFTPPTYEAPIVTGTQYDYNYAQVSLLLNGDGTNGSQVFTDLSSSPKTITAYGNAQISTGTKKFGTGSLAFDGAGDYLSITSNDNLEFGSVDFTIEFWWYPTSTARQALYHGSFGADYSIGIDYSSTAANQKIGLWASSNGTSWNLINSDSGGNGIGTISITQNAWNHIVYVRSGTTWQLYINGVRDLNLTSISGSIVNRLTYPKVIGNWYVSNTQPTQVSGYIDDFRITKGLARYTQNFTPPTAPLPTSGGY